MSRQFTEREVAQIQMSLGWWLRWWFGFLLLIASLVIGVIGFVMFVIGFFNTDILLMLLSPVVVTLGLVLVKIVPDPPSREEHR